MKIAAVRVQQWLDEWNKISFDAKAHRAKPSSYFLLFSLPARDLRALSGIYPRTTTDRKRGKDDQGIQRRHDPTRSSEIREFVRYGHPWAGLSNAQRASQDYSDLRKPGWLPTAIVVNILESGDQRRGTQIASADTIKVDEKAGAWSLVLPSTYKNARWKPSSIPPIEIIDGQHRLWGFGDVELSGEYELPVVAFHGLDFSWQAYLFYTINIKPKRINASLAFDLYPLLRTEEWLEKFEGAAIYRETRAQELVDLLFSHSESPWHKRINMLGESGQTGEMVTQAAWVRSLVATFVKRWEGKRIVIGGLFGTPLGSHKQVLPWSRQEQAAFLITIGQRFKASVKASRAPWAKSLREEESDGLFPPDDDPAYAGKHTLISQDQGVRALLSIMNDLFFLNADELRLSEWGQEADDESSDDEIITAAIRSLRKTSAYTFLGELTEALAAFDWRASSASGLTETLKLMKAAFRGSGGYRDLRRQLLLHLSERPGRQAVLAKRAIKLLGYE